MPWGSYSGSYWGGGAIPSPPAGFNILAAAATGSTTFQVLFSEPPAFVSSAQEGDAQNLTNWTLIREDVAETLTILGVAQTTDPNVLEFFIQERWASELAQYKISAADTLKAASGDPIILNYAEFFGAPSSSTGTTTTVSDILNPQTKSHIEGALSVGSNGDYEMETGVQLLKKLILRRLLTRQGEFYHLSDSDYGLGLRAKDLNHPTDLIALKTKIEKQVAREPEVAGVQASVTMFADGRLQVQLLVTTQNSGQFDLAVPVPADRSGV